MLTFELVSSKVLHNFLGEDQKRIVYKKKVDSKTLSHFSSKKHDETWQVTELANTLNGETLIKKVST